MTKLTPGPDYVRLPVVRSTRNVLTRMTKQGPVMQKWPKGHISYTDSQQFNRDQMTVASFFATDYIPIELETAINWSKGSNDTWKDIFFRAMFGTLFLVITPDGQLATPFNHRYYPDAESEADDMPWTEIKRWTFSIDGATAAIDIPDLALYTELLVAMNAVGCSSSAFRQAVVSTDSGSSYHNAAGNYESIQNNGVPGTQSAFFLTITQTTATQSAYIWFPFISKAEKLAVSLPVGGNTFAYRFIANDLAPTNLRLKPSAGNFNSGRFVVFGR